MRFTGGIPAPALSTALQAIQQSVIHIYVQYLRTILYLLTRDAQRLFIFILLDKAFKLFGTSYIGTFPNVYEIGLGPNH